MSQKLRILIVEDDRDWQDIIIERLQRNGFAYTCATNFDHALKLAQDPEIEFDGAVIDKGGKGSVRTPTVFGYHDGLTVIKELQMYKPTCRTVLLTGESFSQSALSSGAFAYSDKAWLNPTRFIEVLNKGPLVLQEMGKPILNISEPRSPRRPERR